MSVLFWVLGFDDFVVFWVDDGDCGGDDVCLVEVFVGVKYEVVGVVEF